MFTDEEVDYLRSQGLARIATMGPDGQPDVVPVAYEYEDGQFWVGGAGASVTTTRKFRNVAAGADRVALVVDDMVSFDPFIARGIRVYGIATGPVERVGMIGPGTFLSIAPTESWSWNMDGQPVGQEWYPTRHAQHQAD
jgi:pyridoxamine 5'-phosphate oxidase family protein